MPPAIRAVLLAVVACLLPAAPAAHGQTGAARAAGGDVAATEQAPLTGRALVAALRGGGYVLYLRHTSTDFSQNDRNMVAGDCTTQRNLTDAGRAEAREIGAALTALAIPIGTVLASPYCRTMETGRLIFGRVTPSAAVRGGPAQADNAQRYAELRLLLATPVAGGTNLAISSHGNPYAAVVGGPHLAEGEMAVLRPQGDGRFSVVARVRRGDWPALVAAQ